MAIVNVDYSEFETLKNRVKELEETVKEKDKTIAPQRRFQSYHPQGSANRVRDIQ